MKLIKERISISIFFHSLSLLIMVVPLFSAPSFAQTNPQAATATNQSQSSLERGSTKAQKASPAVAISLTSTMASNYVAKFQKGQLTPSQVWDLRTTVGVYREIGHRNPKWDDLAVEALDAFAITRGIEPCIDMAERWYER